jgi:YebC/PmpR family DNA-binding regulatory protein
MSGHSKWSTIKRQKESKDSARGAEFTKLGNAIAIAARSGPDPDLNFNLRLAIDRAKAANMPNANIQRSIDRGSGNLGSEQIQEVLYEGYGPGGVAILVEAATDNINRTFPEIRLAFSKNGGHLAEKGAVAYQFEHLGVIRIDAVGDDVMLKALDAGANDVIEEDNESIIYTSLNDLAKVRDKLRDGGFNITESRLEYVANNTAEITDKELAVKVMRLIDVLEDIDGVTNTFIDFDIPDEFVT